MQYFTCYCGNRPTEERYQETCIITMRASASTWSNSHKTMSRELDIQLLKNERFSNLLWKHFFLQSESKPYFLLVGSDVEQCHRTVGGTAGCVGNFRGRIGLRYRRHTKAPSDCLISQRGGEVLLQLLALYLLEVVLCGVLQVGLHLSIKRQKNPQHMNKKYTFEVAEGKTKQHSTKY